MMPLRGSDKDCCGMRTGRVRCEDRKGFSARFGMPRAGTVLEIAACTIYVVVSKINRFTVVLRRVSAWFPRR